VQVVVCVMKPWVVLKNKVQTDVDTEREREKERERERARKILNKVVSFQSFKIAKRYFTILKYLIISSQSVRTAKT